MNEMWKDISGYEGLYQVSNLGRVRRISSVKFGILKYDFANGYYRVTLSKENKIKRFYVHRLVALTFYPGEIDEEVNHINGIKTDNRVENLEWVSQSRNTFHSYEIGLNKFHGERSSKSKLKDKDIGLIKKLHSEYSMKINTIALIFGVHRDTIRLILKNKTWKYVKEAI